MGTEQEECRDLRNAQLETVHEYLLLARDNARKCDPDDSEDKRVLSWIEGVLEEFGDDVEDCLDLENLVE